MHSENLKYHNKLYKISKARNIKKIMFIGDIDTGKSYLVKFLSGYLANYYKTSIVDLDIGQSHIGPPTVIAWGKVPRNFVSWKQIKTESIYFTGVVSPANNLIRFISGAKLISDIASAKSEKVIIDTTGLVRGNIGRILKQTKIDVVKPDLIIAIERDNELHDILKPYSKTKKPIILKLNVLNNVRKKSIPVRIKYRDMLFKRYFNNSYIKSFNLIKTPVIFLGKEEELAEDRLGKRLVSLRNKNNVDKVIGIIESINEHIITIRIKRHFPFFISSIAIGREKLDSL